MCREELPNPEFEIDFDADDVALVSPLVEFDGPPGLGLNPEEEYQASLDNELEL